MRRQVLDGARPYGRRPESTEISDLLDRLGGYPDLADEILAVSTRGNQLPYAIQENVVAKALRDAGNDAVISYSKNRGAPRLAEVFDLTRHEYP
jgi:hypothetical protein